jgi:hypothetical protein
VRQLAARLRVGGVEVTLDQWQLRLGGDVVRFMSLQKNQPTGQFSTALS